MNMMFNDKRGDLKNWGKIIAGVVLLIVVVYIIFIFWPNTEGVTFESTKNIIEGVIGDNAAGAIIGTILGFIIGSVPSNIVSLSNEISALIALICIWGMFVLASGDILSKFSTFSKNVAWPIAVLLGIAAANLKLIGIWAAAFTQMFAALGMISIYIGLLASFAVFVIVEWGVGGPLSNWALRRQMHVEAMKGEKGRQDVIEGLRTMKGVGKETKEGVE